ncbi:glucose 1-dehydrogenase [Paraburkholderia sp. BCC1876]|uniref:SDR family NAD(P)-dependent oxidoreductase n=1 Tax=Paraburkholderia sp. BCC1876 TaxID=2676303 RepID=UPI001590E15F|nr:glucose 1-dehydrogenase [Paraburkholderia sp. BCC1876]
MDMFNLSGKVALVTGATKGMGQAIAEALGAAGATLVISGRSAKSAAETEAHLSSRGFRARALVMDLNDPESVETFARTAKDAFGRIDVLVLNAAANTPNGPMIGRTEKEFDDVMANNVKRNLTLINAFSRDMIDRRDGSIIFMSSRVAKRGTAQLGLYAVAKAAIDQYVRNLAIELGPFNVNVNSICPGPVRTDFSRVLWEDPGREAQVAAATPMQRIAEPGDVAGLALLLASSAGRFIHGQNISVDGGMTA